MNIIKIYKDSFDGLNRDVWVFAFMMLINRIGTLILPFLTLYTTQKLGWTKIEAGTATMWFGIGSLVGALLGGYLTDKIGYYKTMVLSLFSASVFFYILQYCTEFYVLCGFLLVSSMLADFIRPALMTGLTYFTNKATQTRAVSLVRMAFNLGIAIGPAVAGIMIASYGYSLIFIIDSLTCLGAGIFLLIFVKNKQEEKKEELEENDNGISPYRDFPFLIFMLFNLLMLISFFQILFTVPLFMIEILGYTEREVGYFYAVNGGVIFLSEMPLVHYVETKFNDFKTMIVGALMMGLAIFIFAFPLPSLFMMAFYMFFVSYGEIVNFPFIASISMSRASKGKIGKYMSVNTVMFSLSLIIAPIFGTYVLEAFGYQILFVVMFLLCVISAVGLYYISPVFEKEKV